jgi:hypothetical protein
MAWGCISNSRFCPYLLKGYVKPVCRQAGFKSVPLQGMGADTDLKMRKFEMRPVASKFPEAAK